MMLRPHLPAVLLAGVWAAGWSAYAQSSGPALSIDVTANRHAISPDIYGINFFWTLPALTDPTYSAALCAAEALRPTTRRWGGDSTSTYQWKFDVENLANDWFYELLPNPVVQDTSACASGLPVTTSFNQYADLARTTGGKILATVPVLGWLPNVQPETGSQMLCSYSVAEYGPQCAEDPYGQYYPYTCGNGVVYAPDCSTNPVYIADNKPSFDYAPSDQTFQAQWIEQMLTRYGQGNQGGIAIWSLDNEPIWWDSTHRDIHPNPNTYNELFSVDLQYAQAIKQADPTALVSGPVNDNWASLWESKTDIEAGWNSPGGQWYSNPVDRIAHNNTPLLTWYLQQFSQYEQQHGQRLLDYVDMHAYIAPAALNDAVNGVTPPETAAIQALRLESTREFWDPTYVDNGDYWIVDPNNNGAPIAPYYIPRVQQIIQQYYQGTKLAITEYNWYALDTLNGGLAQADLLGIFGAYGLDLATLWGPPAPTDPGAYAFQIYRNYDGIGGAFGETGVQGVSADQSQLAIYAAVRSDLNLTAVVINKTGGDLTSTLSLANFQAGQTAQVWQYSGANLGAIVAQPGIATGGNNLSATFPANSITMLVIPPATFPVPKPMVAAVTSAASYAPAVAPGQMVIVWGSNMGPTALAGLALDSNGLVSNSVAGVQVLFDGIPAPIVYVSATQIAVVTPYFGTTSATTHVQVEYQGVRSDPFPVAVQATAPGLFTANATGTGQGAILNQDGVTLNSANAPASPGSIVSLWGTGEGVTDPPGVDGRLAIGVLPAPLAAVSVTIQGLPATVTYHGAAPGLMPGVFQIDAQVPQKVQPGNSVPVIVTIGGATTQTGVTLAVE
jgi:uncharacterized protein (TIGR03437 family)